MIYYGIAGCGHIAAKHIEAIRRTEGAVLTAICDPDAKRLHEAAGRTGAAAYATLGDMLAQEKKLDAVCICTPSGLHAEMAVMAARAGRHVVIEKPLALTVEDGEWIAKAVRQSGVKAAVVHPNRYRPAVRELKAALDRGLFGRLGHVSAVVRWNRDQAYYDQAAWRGTKAMDGGVLMNQAIHSLDLLLWLFGDVRQVSAMAETRLRRMEAEDTALALLRFESGVLGTVEASTTVYAGNLEESISVFGEDGYGVIGGKTASWIRHWRCSSMSEEEAAALIRLIEAEPYGIPGHEQIIRDMTAAIQEDREPSVTVEDGLRSVRLVLDILGAAKS
ncbi:oxidoreductase [Paenibacillus yonginensis]|uniref:Oxidoreductase n=1 Tax=Paenibacillus yonginensis TaxID=1462996 RepID=A0A1B1N583_9BACL|nr:Gfo/Idh/MocA family oxidoreductase [Paenibacillus yonginensis]ANS76600.1 oxidoreductase [Paenibacillus yonginensis]